MQVAYHCPGCQQSHQTTVTEQTDQLRCGACGWQRPVPADPVQRSHPTTCLVCGCHDLWRRKNFPQQLGVGMVVLAAILSTIAWAWHEPIWALGILMATAGIDMVLFTLMPDVLVCYRCNTRYLRFDPSGETTHFNLETAERHRQEKIRLKKS